MKKLLLSFLLLFSAIAAGAQVNFTADAPSVVEVGEQFRLVFTCNAEFDNFQAPQIGDGLRILAGPTSSTSYNTQIVNGKRSESRTVSYIYILEAVKPGKFSIGRASIVSGGKTYQSSAINVEVVEGGASQAGDNSTGGNATSINNQDIFMRLTVSKNHVVKGEHLVATLKLYTRVNIASFDDVKFPTFNGFWSQETYTPQNLEFQRENVNGQIYNSAVLRRYTLQPQQTGSITIEPAELVCLIQVRDQARGRSFIDDFFDSYQTVRKRVTSPTMTIKVDALPSGAPASFNGAVGKFSIKARVDRDSIAAHEAISYYIELSGEGNINLIEAPKPVFPPDFEVYDVKITDNSKSSGSSYSGTKQFEYPVIPRSYGDFTIAPVVFSYYDIQSKSYKTISSESIKLKVSKGTEGTTAQGYSGPALTRRSVKSLGEDIRYIFTSVPEWRKKGQFFAGSLFFFADILLIVIIFFLLYFFHHRRRRRLGDVVRTRNRKANKTARLRLRKAEGLLKEQLYAGFYEEIHRALWGYISDKLAWAQADCTKDAVVAALGQRGVPEEEIKLFYELIESCEFARYAPDPGQVEKEKVFEKAISCISSMEQCLK